MKREYRSLTNKQLLYDVQWSTKTFETIDEALDEMHRRGRELVTSHAMLYSSDSTPTVTYVFRNMA